MNLLKLLHDITHPPRAESIWKPARPILTRSPILPGKRNPAPLVAFVVVGLVAVAVVIWASL